MLTQNWLEGYEKINSPPTNGWGHELTWDIAGIDKYELANIMDGIKQVAILSRSVSGSKRSFAIKLEDQLSFTFYYHD